MSWKRYFTPVTVNKEPGTYSPIGGGTSKPGPARANYSSFLPDVYTGAPNRVDRYLQYDTMDNDAEINAALDILTEFCTQTNKENQTPFSFYFRTKATGSEITILREYLQQWCKLQKFDTRIFRIVRNVFKYGDAFFIRDPETKKWFFIDQGKITKIIVNESDGKAPEQYVIRDLNPNFTNLIATTINPNTTSTNNRGTAYVAGGAAARGQASAYPVTPGTRFSNNQAEVAINANHVIHLSLSEGLDNNYPFGNSLLEQVFKVYKQKELLEDAIIIYRVQRAPERRIFYIDVGNMPSHLAMSFVERVKNEVHQRRIPSATGGASNVIDSSFNPLSQNEDFYFPQSCLALDTKIKLLDDRSLTLQELINEYESGKENFTYTVNQKTLEIEPGKIVWAGVTRKNAEVIKVTLDSGESVTVTPDHRFIMRDGSEVEAGKLKTGDSIMPLYLHDTKTGKQYGAGKYLRYVCPATGKKLWVHTMVCKKNVPGKDTEIHHIDCNSRNNSPTNLVEMETKAHRKLHSTLGSYHMTRAWKDPVLRANLLKGIHGFYANATAEDKQMFVDRGRINGANTWKNPDSAHRSLTSLLKHSKLTSDKKRIHYSYEMIQRLLVLYNQGVDSISKLRKVLRSDDEFQQAFRNANPNILRDKHISTNILPTDTNLNNMVRLLGYDSWDNFKKTYKVNHKIASIEILTDCIDTGDLTIESKSGSHNFALDIGIFVHNSEGRGSKVETLPGGCLAMDTEVVLLDGSVKTIAELAKDYQEGKENWTVSCETQTGIVKPGIISWAGVTHKSAKVIKLILSNGKEIVVTPDHKFPMYDSEYKRAGELTVGDELMTTDVNLQTVTVSAIEELVDEVEVGTLTIDKDEKDHNFHTFSLNAGVFTFNSNLGEITDLRYFTNKLFRGLRIPSSYLPTGADDSQAQFNDGRVGTAYIQELRFNEYCKRLQNLLQQVFDQEFKLYLFERGVNIDASLFDLRMQSPLNFAAYRQSEVDGQRINTFSTIVQQPYISKRFALKRYLGLTDEDLAENERLWADENNKGKTNPTDSSGEMRGAGISQAGIDSDMSSMADNEAPPEMGEGESAPGGEGPGEAPTGAAGASPQAGNAPPA